MLEPARRSALGAAGSVQLSVHSLEVGVLRLNVLSDQSLEQSVMEEYVLGLSPVQGAGICIGPITSRRRRNIYWAYNHVQGWGIRTGPIISTGCSKMSTSGGHKFAMTTPENMNVFICVSTSKSVRKTQNDHCSK